MKIGIDCRTILDPGAGEAAGVGHYTYNLVNNLLELDKKNKYVLFFDKGVGDAGNFKRKNSEVKFFPYKEYKKFLPIAYSHLLIASFVSREDLDVFHSPASTIPLAYSKNAIITIHDLAIYKNPNWFPKQYFSTKVSVPQSLKKAKKIIAVSEYTKKDLTDILKIPENKIEVVLNGVEKREDINKKDPKDKDKIKEKFDIKQDFILFIGTLQPRKNIEGLISAFDKLRGNKIFENYQLVIAGKKGWNYKDIFEKVRSRALTKKVLFTNYISKEDKTRLLNAASCFCFPSFYEGFGLSILEAMQQGTPVITSNITSTKEIGGEAAIFIDPYKPSSIGHALKKVLGDENLRKSLIQRGYSHVEKFSWKKCARETLNVYNQIK
ncbi:MAG: glycosyltransferase family 4 protein [Parcubacteria group bacterium]|nr:glycosyltransferase family 4 protein [Parcubacteria group bacterium]